MNPIGNTLLQLLLLLSRFDQHVFAAQPPPDPLLVLPPGLRPDHNAQEAEEGPRDLDFTLRQIYHHGISRYPDLHRYFDVPKDAQAVVDVGLGQAQLAPKVLSARIVSTNIQRMKDRRRSTVDALIDQAQIQGRGVSLPSSAWAIDTVNGPDTTDKKTLVTLAWMAANAYVQEPFTGDWHEIKSGFNGTDPFGWEEDGLRGHVFASKDNSTVVIGLKGTSAAIFDGADTTGNDKLNDNLFGSCCCGQGGDWMWKRVCECQSSAYTCNRTCLTRELREKSHYYHAAQDLYHNVTERYPGSEIWLSGHSLGGVVSALLGLTYGRPTVTFEAYPDAMAAERLGLPVPPGYHVGAHQSRTDIAVHHFGHTADPIFIGQCHGASSPCSIAGYAFEGVCHTGKTCTYDTVNDFGWRVGIGNHKIGGVIRDVIEGYETTANCTEFLDCTDCYRWKFFESNGTETTTSDVSTSTSTYTRTRTETCKTPGWWGCLDEPTTGVTSTTSSSSSTTSCQTPGWFGCKDPITTTKSSTSTKTSALPAPIVTTITTTTTTYPASTTSSSTTSSSTTCETPGWFGCNDPTTTRKPTVPASNSAPPAPSSHSCTSPRWFGLICADPSPTSSSVPSPTHLPTTRRKHCVNRHWYGICKEWRWDTPQDPKTDL